MKIVGNIDNSINILDMGDGQFAVITQWDSEAASDYIGYIVTRCGENLVILGDVPSPVRMDFWSLGRYELEKRVRILPKGTLLEVE